MRSDIGNERGEGRSHGLSSSSFIRNLHVHNGPAQTNGEKSLRKVSKDKATSFIHPHTHTHKVYIYIGTEQKQPKKKAETGRMR